jgi:hypothetical protein
MKITILQCCAPPLQMPYVLFCPPRPLPTVQKIPIVTTKVAAEYAAANRGFVGERERGAADRVEIEAKGASECAIESSAGRD